MKFFSVMLTLCLSFTMLQAQLAEGWYTVAETNSQEAGGTIKLNHLGDILSINVKYDYNSTNSDLRSFSVDGVDEYMNPVFDEFRLVYGAPNQSAYVQVHLSQEAAVSTTIEGFSNTDILDGGAFITPTIPANYKVIPFKFKDLKYRGINANFGINGSLFGTPYLFEKDGQLCIDGGNCMPLPSGGNSLATADQIFTSEARRILGLDLDIWTFDTLALAGGKKLKISNAGSVDGEIILQPGSQIIKEGHFVKAVNEEGKIILDSIKTEDISGLYNLIQNSIDNDSIGDWKITDGRNGVLSIVNNNTTIFELGTDGSITVNGDSFVKKSEIGTKITHGSVPSSDGGHTPTLTYIEDVDWVSTIEGKDGTIGEGHSGVAYMELDTFRLSVGRCITIKYFSDEPQQLDLILLSSQIGFRDTSLIDSDSIRLQDGESVKLVRHADYWIPVFKTDVQDITPNEPFLNKLDGSLADSNSNNIYFSDTVTVGGLATKTDAPFEVSNYLRFEPEETEQSIYIGKGAGANIIDDEPNSNIGNTVIGDDALNLMQNGGGDHVVVGVNSLQFLTDGDQDIAVGADVMTSMRSGRDNTMIGDAAANLGDTLNFNTVVGAGGTMINARHSEKNTFVGWGQGKFLDGGSHNLGLGYEAGRQLTGTANFNTLVGSLSGWNITTGVGNLLLGYGTNLTLSTGNNNVLLGNGLDVDANNTSNYLSIGNLIFSDNVQSGLGNTIGSGNIGIKIKNPLRDLDVPQMRVGDYIFAGDNSGILAGFDAGGWYFGNEGTNASAFNFGNNNTSRYNFAGGTIKGLSYTGTANTASSLGLTESNYLASWATDGTLVKLEKATIDPQTLPNIYSRDGTYTGNRTLTTAGFWTNFAGGNVGINQTAPDERLVVNGSVKATNYRALDDGSVIFASDAGGYYMLGGFGLTTKPFYAGFDANNVRFGANGSEAIRIDPTQRVGIGTTTPTAKLHVVGDTKLLGSITISNGTNVIIASGTGTPEGAITAGVGSTYHRIDGGAGTSFYVKESGSGNTGWVAK